MHRNPLDSSSTAAATPHCHRWKLSGGGARPRGPFHARSARPRAQQEKYRKVGPAWGPPLPCLPLVTDSSARPIRGPRIQPVTHSAQPIRLLQQLLSADRGSRHRVFTAPPTRVIKPGDNKVAAIFRNKMITWRRGDSFPFVLFSRRKSLTKKKKKKLRCRVWRYIFAHLPQTYRRNVKK